MECCGLGLGATLVRQNSPFLAWARRPNSLQRIVSFLWAGVLVSLASVHAVELRVEYADKVRPLLVTYCLECHSTKVQKAGFDIQQFESLADVRSELQSWQEIVEMLENKEMPPQGKLQPTAEERQLLTDWIHQLLREEADRHAGDPGPVVVRRLNNSEYRYTVRDLTGVDLQPTSQFPADGAAGEGFLNATDSLAISPGLMNKYLDTSKKIAAHAIFLPDGFRFSPSEFQQDWVNEVLDEILKIYAGYLTELGGIPLNRYLTATIAHVEQIASENISLDEVAKQEELSPKYLATLWQLLTEDDVSGVVGDIQIEWNACCAARDATGTSGWDLTPLVRKINLWQEMLWRRQRPDGLGGAVLAHRFVTVPLALVKSHEYELQMRPAVEITPCPAEKPNVKEKPADPIVFYLATETLHGVPDEASVVLENPRFVAVDAAASPGAMTLRDALKLAADSIMAQAPEPPEGVQRLTAARIENDSEAQLPDEDRLVLRGSEVLQVYLPPTAVAGKKFVVRSSLVEPTAGKALVRFAVRHSPARIGVERTLKWQGYEQAANVPILIADDKEENCRQVQRSLDRLRQVFPISLCYPGLIVRDSVVTLERFHRDDSFLSTLMLDDRTAEELDRLWQQLHYISQDAKQVLDSLATLLQGEMHAYRSSLEEIEQRATVNEKRRLDSQPHHLKALLDFAGRAYRRPLRDVERQGLADLYQSLRQQEISHQEALRSLLARVLVSPHFLFRIEEPSPQAAATRINGYELATRLSYFLWSSLPDEELLQIAAMGKLHEPAVLAQQTRRMLADEKVRALAIEFGTQWLEVRDFDRFQGKDEQRFPEFDALIRQAMYEESILFFQDLFQADRSVWDMLGANHTFLNERLANYYGVPGIQGNHFRRVEDLHTYGRGGMLGWGSVLSKHSGALRTSPVLRGNWIAETVLGQRLPRPPPEVPELPEDEGAVELTIRELVEKHTALEQCAVCHHRIDPLGFALEEYDTIGRWRKEDLGGRRVDARAELADGATFDGFNGLRQYLLTERRDEFKRQFCRKLLGYALGRGVILSDRKLLEEMSVALDRGQGRLSSAIAVVVTSQQFQYVRGSALVE